VACVDNDPTAGIVQGIKACTGAPIPIGSRCRAVRPSPPRGAGGEGARLDLRADQARTRGNQGPRGGLGGPRLPEAREIAQASIKAHADQHAANVIPIIREAERAGATSLRDIAKVLNARGMATARGGRWHATSVKNVLERLI
jgi:Recombinase